jgi:hypothetical protein
MFDRTKPNSVGPLPDQTKPNRSALRRPRSRQTKPRFRFDRLRLSMCGKWPVTRAVGPRSLTEQSQIPWAPARPNEAKSVGPPPTPVAPNEPTVPLRLAWIDYRWKVTPIRGGRLLRFDQTKPTRPHPDLAKRSQLGNPRIRPEESRPDTGRPTGLGLRGESPRQSPGPQASGQTDLDGSAAIGQWPWHGRS